MAITQIGPGMYAPGSTIDTVTGSGTSGIIIPGGTTAQRPNSPADGTLRFNTDTGVGEFYLGTSWRTFGYAPIVASGGTVSQTTIGSTSYNVHTFNYTGANQTFTISSAGSTGNVQVHMWAGAGGGASGEGYTDPGGAGGYSYGIINIASFSSLIVQVGGGGTIGRGTRTYPAGGLASVRSTYASGNGGGRSGIFYGSVTQGTALLIAGAGGGGAGHGGGGTSRGSQGGAGGGATGESGYSSYQSITANGASQSAAGTQGNKPGYNGLSSGALQGGDAGEGTAWSTGWNQAGGGGDGYFGGGAINDLHQGGGGGSGYFNPSYVTSGLLSSNPSGTNAAGLGPLNPPQTSNTFYSSGIGVGNNNANGGNGKVVILYALS